MRYTLFILLIISCFVGETFASEGEEFFRKGNSAYAENKFGEAIDNYQQVIDLGQESSELYFNMGNAYYKKQEFPYAILFYEKALKLDPLDQEIKTNLLLAKEGANIKEDTTTVFIFYRWYQVLAGLIHSNAWALLSAFLFVLSLGAFLVFFLTMQVSLKRLGFYSGIALLIVSVACFIMAYSVKKYFAQPKSAIVVSQEVIVKGAPNDNSKNVLEVFGGMKVNLVDEVEGWYEIKLNNGDSGWVPTSKLQPI